MTSVKEIMPGMNQLRIFRTEPSMRFRISLIYPFLAVKFELDRINGRNLTWTAA